MNRILTFILAIFLTACTSIAQPPSGPSSLAWEHTGSTSYEAQIPGLGTSERYASPAGWIDVYVYGLRRNDWKPGVSDPQFASHFESTVAEVRLYAQRGLYANLQIDAARDVVVAGNVFRTISFRFSRDSQPMISTTYLTAQNGQLLKYRVSIYAASGLDVAAAAQSFIEKNLRSGRSDSSHDVDVQVGVSNALSIDSSFCKPLFELLPCQPGPQATSMAGGGARSTLH